MWPSVQACRSCNTELHCQEWTAGAFGGVEIRGPESGPDEEWESGVVMNVGFSGHTHALGLEVWTHFFYRFLGLIFLI